VGVVTTGKTRQAGEGELHTTATIAAKVRVRPIWANVGPIAPVPGLPLLSEQVHWGAIIMTTEIKLSLPDKLASEAQEAGLLTPQAIEQLLREAVRRKAVDKLVQKMDEPADATFPPMTLEEIQAEVDAVHAQRRKRAPDP